MADALCDFTVGSRLSESKISNSRDNLALKIRQTFIVQFDVVVAERRL